VIFVDTNIVIDLIEQPDTCEAAWSREAFRDASADTVVSNLIVLAKFAGQVSAADMAEATFASLDIALVDLTVAAALRSAEAFREYRRRGGARTAMLADFLIAGHAVSLGASLLTRNRRLASYFTDLTLITPEIEA
jgi:predicted nucleic acid-binding protein